MAAKPKQRYKLSPEQRIAASERLKKYHADKKKAKRDAEIMEIGRRAMEAFAPECSLCGGNGEGIYGVESPCVQCNGTGKQPLPPNALNFNKVAPVLSASENDYVEPSGISGQFTQEEKDASEATVDVGPEIPETRWIPPQAKLGRLTPLVPNFDLTPLKEMLKSVEEMDPEADLFLQVKDWLVILRAVLR